MSVHGFRHLLILSFVVAAATFFSPGYSTRAENSRRILHQPLFPVGSEPPAGTDSAPPPPPPPPADPVLPSPEQPFFPEVPGGQSPDQNSQPPPLPAQQNESPVSNPIASQPSRPVKKVAIAISVGIVTLGMLSALGFYLYKHRVKRPDESQKLVGGGGGGSQRINEESRMPPSTFLYIGTVEPSTRTSVSETNEANGSPYRKLSSVKRSDRYRPSPDLQPLPPLSKPQPPPDITSPPAMSSSDEESRDTAFYTPQGSTVSNDDGYYTPVSRRSQAKAEARANNYNNNSSTPHSKRTSPKSRLSASPSDVKPAIIPSIKQSPAPSQYDRPTMPYIPKRAKFSSPPPPPDMARLQLISGQTQQPSKLSVPPPPPPPPPPSSAPRKLAISQKNCSPLAPSEPAKQEFCPSPKTPQDSAKTSPSGETERGPSTLERCDSDDIDGSKPKLKALHWDKVRATSDRATVWDQLKSSSFQLNEDMMESLFGCNSANSVPKESIKKPKSVVPPPGEQENRVLDPKKSQNIAILLRALNVTKEEVSEALIDGNPEGLGSELLETLVRMAPTKEEEIKLRDCTSDTSKLGSAERFLKTLLDVPFAFKRVEAMLYRANFESEVNYLRKSFQTLEEASEELKNSRLFLKLLEAVLRTGNRMNTGTNRGDARAFKLDTLLKLVDIKGTDGKTTLLHFVVQEIIRSEGVDSNADLPNMKPKEEDLKRQELQVVAGLSRELGNVKKAAGMDSDVLHSYVSKLETGLGKVRMVLELEKPGVSGKFFESMKMFLKEAEDEIIRIKAEERKALSVVKEVTEYFHGDAAKEGAHPFRIFMIVRDFLSILDNVCKDVGKMHDRTVVGSARSFRIPANASLPVLSRYNVRHNRSSDDDSMSP